MGKRDTKVVLQVSMDLPPGVTANEARNYVREAVQGWKGQYLPQETALTDLDYTTVRVSLVRKIVDYA